MDQQSTLRDQLMAMHTLAANMAIFLNKEGTFCRFCKMRISLRTPKHGHDALCPLMRIMHGDIPEGLRKKTNDAWEKE